MRQTATEEVIARLRADLRPVRRIPRLRTVLAAVALLWLVTGAVALSFFGLRGDLAPLLERTPGYAALLIGLALAAAGGLVAALGASVPGREDVERGGLGLIAAGVLVLLGLAPALLLRAAGASVHSQVPASRDLMCLLNTGWMALPPAVGVAWFVGRAAPHRPGLAVALGIAGAAALGALVTLPTCPLPGVRHWILGHAMAPLLGAVVVAPWLGRLLDPARKRSPAPRARRD